jgi:hypothetical protein
LASSYRLLEDVDW